MHINSTKINKFREEKREINDDNDDDDDRQHGNSCFSLSLSVSFLR